ncbi:MAG: NUDIX hydrolase [Candidatus Promineifilaceae bacterium]
MINLSTATMPAKLHRALTLPNFDTEAAQNKMNMSIRKGRRTRPADLPGPVRVGAVMLLIYPYEGEPHVAYTKRPSSLKDHSGQISFPGGKVEQGEQWLETALRETYEEVGVTAEQIEVIGALTQMYIPPSDFEVHPFVGWCAIRPNFQPNPDEVETLIEAPLSLLLNPETVKREIWTYNKEKKLTMEVPFYHVFGHKIWGATAIMTGEFLARWRVVAASA